MCLIWLRGGKWSWAWKSVARSACLLNRRRRSLLTPAFMRTIKPDDASSEYYETITTRTNDRLETLDNVRKASYLLFVAAALLALRPIETG